MQSLKVRGPFGSLDFQTLLVLGPLQKLLLPFIFHGSVPLPTEHCHPQDYYHSQQWQYYPAPTQNVQYQ